MTHHLIRWWVIIIAVSFCCTIMWQWNEDSNFTSARSDSQKGQFIYNVCGVLCPYNLLLYIAQLWHSLLDKVIGQMELTKQVTTSLLWTQMYGCSLLYVFMVTVFYFSRDHNRAGGLFINFTFAISLSCTCVAVCDKTSPQPRISRSE